MVVHTSKTLDPNGVLPVRVRFVTSTLLPITPKCNILQTFIIASVLEVLGGHDTVSARSIDEVFEGYVAFAALAICINNRGGPTSGVVVLEPDGENFGIFKYLDARDFSMAKQDIVKFGSDLADTYECIQVFNYAKYLPRSMNRTRARER